MEINNEANVKAVHIKCSTKTTTPENGPSKVSFLGYSGDAVNLRDYGFDAPVVYRVSGIKNKQKIPILYNHGEAIGHTLKVNKINSDSAISGRGVLSIPNDTTRTVEQGMKNGFPYEGSMGLAIDDWSKDISFHAKDSVVVNNREFKAPVYVVERSHLREMTLTEFGRDEETSFELLNEERRKMIKNAKPDDQTPQVDPPINNTPAPVDPPAPTPVDPPAPAPTPTIDNSIKARIRAEKLINNYRNDLDLVEKALEEGWDDERLDNAVQLRQLKNSLPKIPSPKVDSPNTLYTKLCARLAYSNGVKLETIEKKWGKEVADKIDNQGPMGPFELCVTVANSLGGDFTGFSDADQVCKFLKNSGYSTFSMPNLFEDAGRAQLEERWALNPPFAVQHLTEGSNKDFRTNSKIRPSGGEMWDGLSSDGKISHTTFGKETRYTTELDTKAQMVVFDRPTIVNDDRDVISSMMSAMVEGAIIVPDYKLGMKMLAQASAAASFWVNNTNSFTSTALTRANLSTRYQDVRQYNENRGVLWNTIINGKWKLIHGPELEETVFDILEQDRIVADAAATGKTGDKNYWFKKLDPAMFAQMGNTGAFGNVNFVSSSSWVLWPSEKQFSPYEITFLRGRKRPTIESVELPGDMLGFGTRGYWDVEVNERENIAIVRCKA